MPPGRRYPLGDGYSEIASLPKYVRVEEHGDPRDADEMTRYFAAIERTLAADGLDAMLIVAQKQAANAMSPHWRPIREARWKALSSSRAKRIAVVVEDELAVTRVQMTAVSMKAPVKAFRNEAAAIAWLEAPREG